MVQKKQEITYRELRKEDYRQMERILGDTWGFSRRCKDQKVVRLLEKSYWASLLTQENFARVALINGKPVGVVLARKEGKGRKNFTMNFRGLFYGIRLGLSQEGRSNLKLFRELNRQNRQMFKEQGEKFDGELIYLNILRSKKGKGMGTQLWEDAKAFIKENGDKNFFFFTDTTCDYKFYEKKGCQRICASEKIVDISGQRKHLEMFIYKYEL